MPLLQLLSSRAAAIIAGVLLVLGLLYGAYMLGGSAQRAADAEAQLKQLNEERKGDAKRDKAAPVNASDGVIDNWLLHYTYN